ncbi:MAG: anthranilate phosphoribosyltransferase [Candidatus Ranarchaeia archaeon]
MIKQVIQTLLKGSDLALEEAKEVMAEIMNGKATPSQIAAFLVALRLKGETVPEITAFATVMREFCHSIHPRYHRRILDIVGTGGDKIKTFNVSTISAVIVAGAGVTVAKHGNRSVTSQCGSADVLEKLGYNLTLQPKEVESLINKVGMGFMFAPAFHPAMKHAIGPRREIGIRTVFNILGPLTNPANANAFVMGVFSSNWLAPLAKVLQRTGCEEAMLVHGVDGLDELSTVGPTSIVWLRNGEILSKTIHPRDFGLQRVSSKEIAGGTPDYNAELTFQLLSGRLMDHDPRKEIVLLNAAAGLAIGGLTDSISEGVILAREVIEDGRAYKKMRRMIKESKGDMSRLEEMEQKYG